MKTQNVKVDIPDGWELACDRMRKVKLGEYYLTACGGVSQWEVIGESTFSYPILKKGLSEEIKDLLTLDGKVVNAVAVHQDLFRFLEQEVSRGGQDHVWCDQCCPGVIFINIDGVTRMIINKAEIVYK